MNLYKTIFLCALCFTSLRATADPLTITNHNISTEIYPDFYSAIAQSFKILEKDGVAVVCIKGKGDQVKLHFRERLTIKESNTRLILSIKNVVDEVRIKPEIQINKDFNTWEFSINPNQIDQVTLTLGSTKIGFVDRVFKLSLVENKKSVNKTPIIKTKKANESK